MEPNEILRLSAPNNTETNLSGHIQYSSESNYSMSSSESLLIELEAVMTKYKVTHINIGFDTFKMLKNKR